MSPPMTLPMTLPAAILETVISGLAALFLVGANGDTAAARQAAFHLLNAYRPQTEDELRLAANIIGFSFQALEALGQAAAPELPITRALRLRGSAVSLSREAARAERRLTQLHKAREQATDAQAAEIHPGKAAKIEQAVAPVSPPLISTPLIPTPLIPTPVNPAPLNPARIPTAEVTPAPVPTASTTDAGKIAPAAEANGITWTQANDQRQTEIRIAASIKRAEARFAAQSPVIGQDHQPIAAAT